MKPRTDPAGGEERAAGPTADASAEELTGDDGVPAYRVTAWEEEHPGLAAGVTAGSEAGDMGLASERPPAEWWGEVRGTADALGARGVALPVQVHGRTVAPVRGGHDGVLVPGEADGLTTGLEGTLLAVTVADCVPVFLMDPATGALALLHAGWRGTAAGVLEAGVEALESRHAARRSRLRAHLGPAICGQCYEVGPEVARALGREVSGASLLDLREELAERATGLGLAAERLTRSAACTRCGADHFFSHRGTGTARRMMAFLGWREGSGGV